MSELYVPASLIRLLTRGRRVRIDVGECRRVSRSYYGVSIPHPREFSGALGVIDDVGGPPENGHVYRVVLNDVIWVAGAPLAFGATWCAASELTPLDANDNPITPSLAGSV